MSDIENKVVAITGASSGIGEATARLLAEKGASVLLGARRTERLEALANEINAKGGKAAFAKLDVTDAQNMQEFIDYAIAQFGKLDVLFSNAGVMPLSMLSSRKTDEWNRMIDVNIRGVLNGINAALPVFEKQGSGHFINTASIGAHVVVPTGAVYCATKYAVWAISEGLRQESKTTRVTTICPGVVETELGNDITEETSKNALKEFRKTSLSPDAIARGVAYAIEQPKDVDINEVIIRPTVSVF
ncbi:SDR family oxidoreductase [Thalassospira sp. MCCC 1A01428]|uniref:SDR family oxidoreductase n=1 Tax=Thalassospira sp. MCCC 1A01428 TaxID=1470575 RepID=UPI000A1DD0E6|nr:SDR family oxidoreductase [Thalassospira sp. MCCC 1A01428]OSQ41115.1 oxidoreductase [Thalassospira sp. MCCC 1A01428]